MAKAKKTKETKAPVEKKELTPDQLEAVAGGCCAPEEVLALVDEVSADASSKCCKCKP